jgi:hypothetical protein
VQRGKRKEGEKERIYGAATARAARTRSVPNPRGYGFVLFTWIAEAIRAPGKYIMSVA